MTQTKFVSRLDMADARVDRENGIIHEVSLLSLGEARGYDQYADRKTLEQVRDCAKRYAGGLRVKFNAATFNHGDGALAGRIPADTIRVRGDQTIGDIHVYKTFKDRDYLFEIAETAPDNCGLSIHFGGVPERIGEKSFARCDEIFDATVVDLPAANQRGLFRANDQEPEENIMTDEEIKKQATAFADALKPVIEEGNKQVIAAFRAANGNTSQDAPTDEEKAAAGVTDTDTPEEATAKVMSWRGKVADKPVTVKDLFSFFRFAGGKPARISAGAKGEEGSDKATHPFMRHVQQYRAAGMNEGKAIARARADHGKEYNAWVKAGSPTTTFKQE